MAWESMRAVIHPIVSQHLFLHGFQQELGTRGLSGGVSGSRIKFHPVEVLCRAFLYRKDPVRRWSTSV